MLVSSRLCLWVLVRFLFLLLDLVESAFLGEVDFLVLMPNGLNLMVQFVFLHVVDWLFVLV